MANRVAPASPDVASPDDGQRSSSPGAKRFLQFARTSKTAQDDVTSIARPSLAIAGASHLRPVDLPKQGSLESLAVDASKPTKRLSFARSPQPRYSKEGSSRDGSFSKDNSRASGPVTLKRRLTRQLTLTGYTWRTIDKRILDRTRRNVWEDSTADVGSLYAQGVTAIGRLFWTSDDETQQEPARFASVRVPGTDADCAVKLLLSYWRIEKPSVLLSVTGSAQACKIHLDLPKSPPFLRPFRLMSSLLTPPASDPHPQAMDLEPRLEHFLEEGLFAAARSTHAWVVTGGTDTGVMELAGRALRARDTNLRMAESMAWTTPLIGIAPLSKVSNGPTLRQTSPDDGAPPPLIPYVKRERNSSSSAALDHNHSHFVLVENTEHTGWGGEIEMRASVEKRLSEKLAVPVVLIVVQGGRNTLTTVTAAFRNNCPVVLVRESGGCARALADFILEMTHAVGRVTAHEGCVGSLCAKMEAACPAGGNGAHASRLHYDCVEVVRLLFPPPPKASTDSPMGAPRDHAQLVHIFSLEDQRTNSLETSILEAVVASCKRRSHAQTNLLTPSHTFSRLLAPSRAVPRRLTPSHTFSHLLTPSHAFSRLLAQVSCAPTPRRARAARRTHRTRCRSRSDQQRSPHHRAYMSRHATSSSIAR